MFAGVLVANRGEIALRIMRTCREMGIRTIAVYSDADAGAAHVAVADRAVRIGPAPPGASYLRGDAIIDAARAAGADAIHPGYGFLAESPAFAAACADAGLVFIGPPAEAIEKMGSKIEARRLMAAAGVPVVPGESPADQTPAAVEALVQRVGLPAVIKASAGGGGIGMRVVRSMAETTDAIAAARRDAEAAFDDGTLYVERLIDRPRHVEVQVLADDSGQVVHLFERECSLQRRHQKVVEESPSPALTPALRRRMTEAAVAATHAAGYRSAGTIEFLVEPDGEGFYFLEMNTRLQVEHPVTELVTGVDLVRAQIAVAAGQPLPWRQERLRQRGHAVECRVYAEDPDRDFLPQAGHLLVFRPPAGPGVRVDAGVREGDEVPVHYDPLLAKLVAGAESRAAALARAERALREFAVLGIRTNVPFLLRVLAHPDVRAGRLDTTLLDREATALTAAPPPDDALMAMAAVAAHARGPATGAGGPRREPPERHLDRDPWESPAGWRP